MAPPAEYVRFFHTSKSTFVPALPDSAEVGHSYAGSRNKEFWSMRVSIVTRGARKKSSPALRFYTASIPGTSPAANPVMALHRPPSSPRRQVRIDAPVKRDNGPFYDSNPTFLKLTYPWVTIRTIHLRRPEGWTDRVLTGQTRVSLRRGVFIRLSSEWG